MSIAPTHMQETWRPTLHHVAVSGGGDKVVAANPSLPGVVPPGSVAGTVVAAAAALVAIPVLTVKVA